MLAAWSPEVGGVWAQLEARHSSLARECEVRRQQLLGLASHPHGIPEYAMMEAALRGSAGYAPALHAEREQLAKAVAALLDEGVALLRGHLQCTDPSQIAAVLQRTESMGADSRVEVCACLRQAARRVHHLRHGAADCGVSGPIFSRWLDLSCRSISKMYRLRVTTYRAQKLWIG